MQIKNKKVVKLPLRELARVISMMFRGSGDLIRIQHRN